MIPKIYILEEEGPEEVKRYLTPEPEEIKNIENQMKWGMTRGVVEVELRTKTVYWEL